ncbi:MAG TPA: polysaccharide pyruvyl transferase family protein, partial [Bacteroidia bacterium]|nr:polysaccharide pyruvyl transferase family protein [Bacteroidia bacterium]
SLSLISARPELLRYARRRSGQISDFAYVLEPEGEFLGSGLSFHAVGLSDPAKLDDEARTRLLSTLRRADFLGVRDEAGADFLEAEGLNVERMPCALSVLPQVCARQLREVRDHAALEAIRHRFPNGWITVETSGVRWSDFERLASALREVSDREGLGLVFFEANRPAAAQSKLRHWVEAFPEWQAAEFPSSNLWEIASLLLHSRLYCGSCLSSRIVCMSGGVARINVPTGSPEVLSYCELWEHDSVPIEFSDGESWSDALDECLRTDLADLQRHSAWLHDRYRESFDRFCRATGIGARLVPAEKRLQDSTVPMGFHPLAADRAAMAKSVPRNSRRPNFLRRLRA